MNKTKKTNLLNNNRIKQMLDILNCVKKGSRESINN